MNLSQLFLMQSELDSFIQQNRDAQTDVFQEKGLALIVELAELANETRCFKFWSEKGPSAEEVILEEFVDSIHFLLSLGIERGFERLSEWPKGEIKGDLTELFIQTTNAIHCFLIELSMDTYKNVWVHYGAIAKLLGFSNEQIVSAYIAKNDENMKRQKLGY